MSDDVEIPHPRGVQLRRTKGWRMPPGTVTVSRPGPFGNPFVIRDADQDDPFAGVAVDGPGLEEPHHWYTRAAALADAVGLHLSWLAARVVRDEIDLAPLRGHDLACWCPLDGPCHRNNLLVLANLPPGVVLAEIGDGTPNVLGPSEITTGDGLEGTRPLS